MQEHLDRLTSTDASFLHQEGARVAHAHRRGPDLRRTGARLRRVRRPHPQPAAPRPALPPEARHAGAADRAAAVDRRSGLQPRVPRPPHRAARARDARSSCCCSPRGSRRSGSIDPSRCGSTGWSRASRATASRSSPRPITRSSTGSPASTWRRSSSISNARRRRRRGPRAVGGAARALTGRAAAGGRSRIRALDRIDDRARSSPPRPARRRRCTSCATPPRVSESSSGRG